MSNGYRLVQFAIDAAVTILVVYVVFWFGSQAVRVGAMKPKEYWVVRDGTSYINEHGNLTNRKEAYRYSYRDTAYASAGNARSRRVVHVTVKPRAKGFELPKGEWWTVSTAGCAPRAVFATELVARDWAFDNKYRHETAVTKVTVK